MLVAVAQVVDFYLDDARSAERQKIIELAKRDDAASLELLKGYVREAQSSSRHMVAFYFG